MAKVNTRIQSKHDVEKNWANATFAPLPGEIIIYDKDKGVDGGTHEKPRIKVGDGTTAVGSLPFVVDKEATDAAIAEVDATVQTAIKGVTANGTSLTFTKVDGSTVSVTTQDTNTDTKVTNTKANTTKAYVTGTTNSATNTGTQVFDTGVYLGTEAGSLHATKFVGKAMKDDLGNTISTTYETQADATEKLSTAKSYTDSKTANMNKEAYLSWGGQNLSGQVSPLDASLVDDFGANRFAFYPKDNITLEYSRDGGSTWSIFQSTMAELKKMQLVGGTQTDAAYRIGNSDDFGIDKSNYMCRITFQTTNCLYAMLSKFAILVSTNGSTNCYCTIDVRSKEKQDANEDTWVTLADHASISGWSGWNIINTRQFATYGNTVDQYSQIRFTFGVGQHESSCSYSGLGVMQIQAYGPLGYWQAPTNMSRNGHLYAYDRGQNAAFPAKVTATEFAGPLQGNADSATKATNDGDGNIITATYATKAALEKETNCTRTLTGSVNGEVSLTFPDIAAAKHNMVLELSSQNNLDHGYLWSHTSNNTLLFSTIPFNNFVYSVEAYYDFSSDPPAVENLNPNSWNDKLSVWNSVSNLVCQPPVGELTNFICTVGQENSNSNMYYLAMLFYSAALNKVFIVDVGCPYGSDGNEQFSFYFDNRSGKLYTFNTLLSFGNNPDTSLGKHVYEGLPSDLVYFTTCMFNEDKASVVTGGGSSLSFYGCNHSSLACGLYRDEGGPTNFNFGKDGTYLLPYDVDISHLFWSNTPTSSIQYTLSYLSDSSHVKLLPHIRDCSEQNFLEEFNKVVSSGTADPDNTTPGVLYFKYL